MEDEFEGWEAPDIGSALQPPRKVNPKFVNCPPSAANKAITGPDPVGTIQKANTRGIELLDNVIDVLQSTRKKIVAGASGWPTISDALGQALQRCFHMDANNRNIWTRRGEGTVDVLIRRFRGARQILADGSIRYTCLGAATVSLRGCSTTPGNGCPANRPNRRAVSCGGNSHIVLCKAWWSDGVDDQAGTLLHECFHIYFEFIKDAGILANAHCYEQFVLDLNGLAVPAGFEFACP